MTTNQDKKTAQEAFIQHKANIDIKLETLKIASADHFDSDPDKIHWGDVALLNHIEKELDDIIWQIYNGNEHR